MFDEQWQFAVEVEREYAQYRKKVMMRYHLSAAEVDILLFLANNSQFDLATDIVRVRKMQKSHVSLAVNGLCEKGYLRKEGDMADRKKVHLKLEPAAAECVCYGQKCQKEFGESLFCGISEEDKKEFLRLCELIRKNVIGNAERPHHHFPQHQNDDQQPPGGQGFFLSLVHVGASCCVTG